MTVRIAGREVAKGTLRSLIPTALSGPVSTFANPKISLWYLLCAESNRAAGHAILDLRRDPAKIRERFSD